jgi:O-antigen/teichoic acid export membrane protein
MERILQRFSTNQRLVAGQTIVQLCGKAVTVIGTLLVIRLISSEAGLGAAGYDAYAVVIAYVAYFYLILDFGFNTVFVQWATNSPECRATYFSQLLSLRVVLAAAMIVLGLIILSFLPGHTYTTAIKLGIIASLITIAFQGLFITSNAYFQLELKYQWSVAVVVVSALLNLALTYLAVTLGFGLFGVILAYIAEFVALGVGGLLIVRRYMPWHFNLDWSAWRSLIVEALPLGLSIVLTILYFRSDMFLLGVLPLDIKMNLSGERAVGLYSMAYGIFEVMLTLPAFIMNSIYPLMLQAFSQSVNSLRDLMVKTLLANAAMAIVLTLALIILSPLAIHIQSDNNPDFNSSISLLRILSLGLPAFFTTNVLMFTLIALGHKRWLPFVYILAGIINLAGNIWLIPHFGPTAAAYMTIATEYFILALLAVTVWSAFGRANASSVAEVAPVVG